MSILLTASGMGRDATEFHQEVINIVDEDQVHYDQPLDWHMDAEIQIIGDFLDTRQGKRVVGDLADQIYKSYSNHFDSSGYFVILSNSSGSRLVEEALAMIFESTSQFPVKHIMLAPAIGGNDWAKVGDFASFLITAVLTGAMVLEDEEASIGNFIRNMVETNTLEEILQNETVVKKISEGLQDLDLELPAIERHILYGRQDELIDQIDPDLPGKTVLYKGDYNHHEVGDLSEAGLKQLYERSNGIRTQLKNIVFGENISKEEIITSNMSTLI